jgi:CheY-like chemotaxis protein
MRTISISQRILLVDDDPETTQTLQRLLTASGFLVKEENDSSQALQAARDFQPVVVVLDFLMPRVHGGDVAWQLASDAALHTTPRVILCSGVPISEFALKLPPIKIDVVEKPVPIKTLLRLLGQEPGRSNDTVPAEASPAHS